MCSVFCVCAHLGHFECVDSAPLNMLCPTALNPDGLANAASLISLISSHLPLPKVPHHQWILLQNVACYRSNILGSVSNFDGQDQSRRIGRPILQGISCSNVLLHAWQFAAVAVSWCTGAGCYGSLFDGRHATLWLVDSTLPNGGDLVVGALERLPLRI